MTGIGKRKIIDECRKGVENRLFRIAAVGQLETFKNFCVHRLQNGKLSFNLLRTFPYFTLVLNVQAEVDKLRPAQLSVVKE
jgi:hypothetical protein